MLLQHYGLPVIVALNHFGSDTEREFEMIGKHLGEQGVEALVVAFADFGASSTLDSSPGVRHARRGGYPVFSMAA